MATISSTDQSWDAVTGGVKRNLRNVVALQVTATNAAVVAQTPEAGTGFDVLTPAGNLLEFAVPQLLDSDEVIGAQLAGGDASIFAVAAARSASGASPKVKVLFWNGGADDANIAADPVILVIYVARR